MTAARKKSLDLVVLAAGKGKRMRSPVPKPLIPLCGRPMVQWVVDKARKLNPRKIHLVVPPGEREEMSRLLKVPRLLYATQNRPDGTGSAVEAALPGVSRSGTVMILVADAPLMEISVLRLLLRRARDGLALLCSDLDDPTGYGRIVRGEGGWIDGIVEHRDATKAQRKIRTVYVGAMAGPGALFRRLVPKIRASAKTGEKYLTDIAAMAAAEGNPAAFVVAPDARRCLGANTAAELSDMERFLERDLAQGLQDRGAMLRDAASLRIRGDVTCAEGVEIDANVVLEGEIRLGRGVRIKPNCVLRNVEAGRGTVIEAFSHLEDCRIGADCTIGPFARIRAEAKVGDRARVGNFVEVKKSSLGDGAKASHLSYLGDAEVGAGANIGAGVITCNYDGVKKHRTVIGDRAFIGSGAELVAPVRIGSDALVGAGSTLTKDVAPSHLAVERAPLIRTRRRKSARKRN